MTVRESLAEMVVACLLERTNIFNPQCLRCSGHRNPENLIEGFCAQCCDDILQEKTGCRFGEVLTCNPNSHPDCWMR